MRNLPALSALALAVALVGCVPAQTSPPAPADNWVDQQIAQSATTLSLAQQRVHQTAPVPTPKPVLPAATAQPPVPTVPTVPGVAAAPVAAPKPAVSGPVVATSAALPAPEKPPAVVVTAGAAASTAAIGSPGPVVSSSASAKPQSGAAQTAASVPAAQTATSVPVAAAKPVEPPKAVPKPRESWPVSPSDKTVRQTLAKWATKAGWTFVPVGRDYWTVEQDFDVIGSDVMYGDFMTVVRRLLSATTDQSSTPLQPCFHTANNALRVIPTNQLCKVARK